MTRVIWFAGTSGAGTSSLVADTAREIVAEGRNVVVIDASSPATSPAEESPLLPLLSAVRLVSEEVGADSLPPEAWMDLPGREVLAHWGRITAAQDDADVVLVDAGSLSSMRQLVTVPGVLGRILHAMTTPRTAMWRTAAGDGVFDDISSARAQVQRWTRVLESEGATARLVCRPEPREADRVLREAAVLSLHGLTVEGMVVSRMPRAKEGWPGHVLSEARECLGRLESQAQGALVWKSTSRRRCVPRTHEAAAVWSTTGSAMTVRDGQWAVMPRDDGFVTLIPLRRAARSEARLGTTSTHIVLEFDGTYRWLERPAVLQRCDVVSVRRVDGGLQVEWTPNPQVWPKGGSR